MPELTQAPDPHPKMPRIKAPPGACDTHVHLFGPTGKYPFASDSPYEARDALPETLIALQDMLGLSSAVIVSPAGYGRNMAMLADVLGRYRFDRDTMPARTPSELDVTFRTVHASKGLEADFVVLPNVSSGTYGFPSEVADDPVLALAMTEADPYPYAEERRLSERKNARKAPEQIHRHGKRGVQHGPGEHVSGERAEPERRDPDDQRARDRHGRRPAPIGDGGPERPGGEHGRIFRHVKSLAD